MMELEPGDLVSADIDWWAVDRIGQVGHFAHCVAGAIPVFYLQNLALLDELDSPLEGLEMTDRDGVTVQRRPVEGLRILPGRWADRGLYSYDVDAQKYVNGKFVFDIWTPTQRYRLQKAPGRPIKLDELPDRAREILSNVVIGDLVFGDTDVIELQRDFATTEFEEFA